MKITLNNNNEEFNADYLSVSEIMEIKKFTFKLLVVKLNDKLILKEKYKETYVKNGDNLVILHLISGG